MHTVSPWLSIGSVRETSSRTTIYSHEIGTISQLAHSAQYPGIESLYIPVEDGLPLPASQLQQGVTFARAKSGWS